MTLSISRAELALQFCMASLHEKDAESMKDLTAEHFYCQSCRSSGEKVILENVHEMIVALKASSWLAECRDFHAEWFRGDIVETSHCEILNRASATTLKVQSSWTFAFTENNLISSIHVTTSFSLVSALVTF